MYSLDKDRYQLYSRDDNSYLMTEHQPVELVYLCSMILMISHINMMASIPVKLSHPDKVT